MPYASHRIHIGLFSKRLVNALEKLVGLVRKEIDKAATKCFERKELFEEFRNGYVYIEVHLN